MLSFDEGSQETSKLITALLEVLDTQSHLPRSVPSLALLMVHVKLLVDDAVELHGDQGALDYIEGVTSVLGEAALNLAKAMLKIKTGMLQ